MDYRTIGNALQIERDIVHVKPDVLGIQSSHVISRADGMILFNEVAEKNGLHPVKDPRGYMVLDDNVHQYLRDSYLDEYENAYDKILNNQMIGTEPAVKYVIDNLNKTIRNDISEHLPSGLKYSELRFIRCTDDMKDIIDDLAADRVKITVLSSVKRQVEESTIRGFSDNVKNNAQQLSKLLSPQQEFGLEL